MNDHIITCQCLLYPGSLHFSKSPLLLLALGSYTCCQVSAFFSWLTLVTALAIDCFHFLLLSTTIVRQELGWPCAGDDMLIWPMRWASSPKALGKYSFCACIGAYLPAQYHITLWWICMIREGARGRPGSSLVCIFALICLMGTFELFYHHYFLVPAALIQQHLPHSLM